MTKIRQSLVPVLLLATVAISTSNVLPILSINQLETEPVSLDGQLYDNIFSSKNEPRNILNDIFYTISIATPHNYRQQKEYGDLDNNRPGDDLNVINKENAYNGEGFRKEQWHNYPRQLDRLHEYLYEHHNTDKRNPDPDDPNDYDDDIQQTNPDNEIKTNENHFTTNDKNGYETIVAATNPFLIFKIRLACLSNKLKNTEIESSPEYTASEPEYIPGSKNEVYENIINPEASIVKVKREKESVHRNIGIPDKSITKNRAVKKRIFSLWSRLQSFNHKGHELQHRRHLHAYYGLPEGEGGVLTAETRATFLRPPGSPLRWG